MNPESKPVTFIPDDAPDRPQGRYVPFENLLRTGRAVKKSGSRLIVAYAGDQDERERRAGGPSGKRFFQFESGGIARDEARMLGTILRTARTDHAYNELLDWYRDQKRKPTAQAADTDQVITVCPACEWPLQLAPIFADRARDFCPKCNAASAPAPAAASPQIEFPEGDPLD